VLATVHSSTCAEALQRVISAFAAEIQNSVKRATGGLPSRGDSRSGSDSAGPEHPRARGEILMATHAVKNFIRNRDFFKSFLPSETGAEHGNVVLSRYAKWLDGRTNCSFRVRTPTRRQRTVQLTNHRAADRNARRRAHVGKKIASPRPASEAGGRIEIEPDESDFGKILKKPE